MNLWELEKNTRDLQRAVKYETVMDRSAGTHPALQSRSLQGVPERMPVLDLFQESLRDGLSAKQSGLLVRNSNIQSLPLVSQLIGA